MPCCQFCKAPGHTLIKCNSEQVAVVFEKVIGIVDSRPYDLLYQIEELKRLKRAELAVTCSLLNQYVGDVKDVLINRIVRELFTRRTNDLNTVSDEDISYINITYEIVNNLLPHNSRESSYNSIFQCVNMIELFYLRRFGIRRRGLSIYTYYGRVNLWIQAQARGENLYTFLEQFDSPDEQRRQRRQHFGPLHFAVTVDASLTVQECCICCDNKQMAKLGCNHEFCVDCLFGSASVRNKSFITCAMCRAEITDVAVIDDESKTEFEARISS
jgi:hypothetical protein